MVEGGVSGRVVSAGASFFLFFNLSENLLRLTQRGHRWWAGRWAIKSLTLAQRAATALQQCRATVPTPHPSPLTVALSPSLRAGAQQTRAKGREDRQQNIAAPPAGLGNAAELQGLSHHEQQQQQPAAGAIPSPTLVVKNMASQLFTSLNCSWNGTSPHLLGALGAFRASLTGRGC
jgi:hypothetical protein